MSEPRPPQTRGVILPPPSAHHLPPSPFLTPGRINRSRSSASICGFAQAHQAPGRATVHYRPRIDSNVVGASHELHSNFRPRSGMNACPLFFFVCRGHVATRPKANF